MANNENLLVDFEGQDLTIPPVTPLPDITARYNNGATAPAVVVETTNSPAPREFVRRRPFATVRLQVNDETMELEHWEGFPAREGEQRGEEMEGVETSAEAVLEEESASPEPEPEEVAQPSTNADEDLKALLKGYTPGKIETYLAGYERGFEETTDGFSATLEKINALSLASITEQRGAITRRITELSRTPPANTATPSKTVPNASETSANTCPDTANASPCSPEASHNPIGAFINIANASPVSFNASHDPVNAFHRIPARPEIPVTTLYNIPPMHAVTPIIPSSTHCPMSVLVGPLAPVSYIDWVEEPTTWFKEKLASISDVMEVEFYEASNGDVYARVYMWKMGAWREAVEMFRWYACGGGRMWAWRFREQ
ncbi:hypothetical protein B0T14DRAFT_567952 [Immersiella caudata]|uniref:Uncharacterized protein n=1 Tax=Immersiella caudata TaxID=314043 RepID=A0AA39WJ32_9PEZI|nr:hypothetical protein B0T14DRAFT_567952 [Immersiella caudata]